MYPSNFICETCPVDNDAWQNLTEFGVKPEDYQDDHLYNPWVNYWRMVLIIVLGSPLSFLVLWAIHKFKAGHVVPYKGPG